MEHLTVDRIEGTFAVCEMSDRSTKDIPLDDLPAGAGEGTCLTFDGKIYAIDAEEESERRARIKGKMNSLFVD